MGCDTERHARAHDAQINMMRINDAEREEIFRDSLRGKIVSIMSLSAKKGGARDVQEKRREK